MTPAIWDHFTILLRDYQGTHVVWIDSAGGEHHHTWSNPHESAGFIARWVEQWRNEHAASAPMTRREAA